MRHAIPRPDVCHGWLIVATIFWMVRPQAEDAVAWGVLSSLCLRSLTGTSRTECV